jgi:hypothetical protein
MSPAYYPLRKGEYVYNVDVSKDDTARLSVRYRAHLSNVERIENGRLEPIQVDVADTYRTNRQRSDARARRTFRRVESSASCEEE